MRYYRRRGVGLLIGGAFARGYLRGTILAAAIVLALLALLAVCN